MNYPFYWSYTTHVDSSGHGSMAVYVAFGEAFGYMSTVMEPPSRENRQGPGKGGSPPKW